MTEHRVQRGECINSIADRYGLFPDTVWDAPENEALREQRGDPSTLMPGDMVFVPDVRPKTEKCFTGHRHRFRRKGVPAKLRIQVGDEDEPMAGVPFSIDVEGAITSGETDDDAVLEVWVSPQARRATLAMEEETFELAIGTMAPAGEVSGVQARLNNLGYYVGDEDGVLGEHTQRALYAFQAADPALEPTGELDDATIAAIARAHDEVDSGILAADPDLQDE